MYVSIPAHHAHVTGASGATPGVAEASEATCKYITRMCYGKAGACANVYISSHKIICKTYYPWGPKGPESAA